MIGDTILKRKNMYLIMLLLTLTAFAEDSEIYSFRGYKNFTGTLDSVTSHYEEKTTLMYSETIEEDTSLSEKTTSSSSCTKSGYCYKCGYRQTFSKPFGSVGCGYGHHFNCDGRKETVTTKIPTFKKLKVTVFNKKQEVIDNLIATPRKPLRYRTETSTGSCR